ncbi:MAG: hypothetical protein GYB68_04255, partial [Chloroflexi bacterium]|nr:hypothetical protein [Chloroflexota bacterium]
MTTSDKPNESLSRTDILRSILVGAIGGLVLVGAFFAGYLLRDYQFNQSVTDTSFALLNEVEGLIATHYLYDVPDQDNLIHGAAGGLVGALNEPYTYFVEPATAEVDAGNLAGAFGGIGAEIARNESGEFVILRVYRENPAAIAGLQADDV